jgi:hypothetical protein
MTLLPLSSALGGLKVMLDASMLQGSQIIEFDIVLVGENVF